MHPTCIIARAQEMLDCTLRLLPQRAGQGYSQNGGRSCDNAGVGKYIQDMKSVLLRCLGYPRR